MSGSMDSCSINPDSTDALIENEDYDPTTRSLTQAEQHKLSAVFLKTEYEKCANRDCKQLFRTMLITLNWILGVVITFYFIIDGD